MAKTSKRRKKKPNRAQRQAALAVRVEIFDEGFHLGVLATIGDLRNKCTCGCVEAYYERQQANDVRDAEEMVDRQRRALRGVR